MWHPQKSVLSPLSKAKFAVYTYTEHTLLAVYRLSNLSSFVLLLETMSMQWEEKCAAHILVLHVCLMLQPH